MVPLNGWESNFSPSSLGKHGSLCLPFRDYYYPLDTTNGEFDETYEVVCCGRSTEMYHDYRYRHWRSTLRRYHVHRGRKGAIPTPSHLMESLSTTYNGKP